MTQSVTLVSSRWFKVLKWVGLVVGCSAKFITGSLFVINVYEGAIKSTFNFTQKELNLQASLLNIGLGVGFVPGMFYDKFGPQWTSLAGLVVSVAGYMLLWSTTKNVDFYKAHSGLMAFYFFICGFGSVFTYMVALNTNVINFHVKHRGKVVGLLNAFFAGSPSIFAVIYYNVIAGTEDERNSPGSFSNFMLLFAILFGIFDLICMVFLRIYKVKDQEDTARENGPTRDFVLTVLDDNIKADRQHNGVEEQKIKSEQPSDAPSQTSLLGILKNVDFHLFSWTFTCASVAGLVYNVVLTQTTNSLGLSTHDPDLVVIIPSVNAFISLSIGIFSDVFKERFPRLAIVIFGCLAFTVTQILSLTLADKYEVLIIACVTCGIGVGIIWSISPTIMSEYFCVSNLGRNWGMALFLASLVGLAGQEIFGAVYDHNVPEGEIYCYGMACVRGGHAAILGFAVLSFILGLILFFKRKRSTATEFR